MAEAINVIQRTQIIKVDPVTGDIVVNNAGPSGPGGVGSPGPTGPPGPPGIGSVPIVIDLPYELFVGLAPGSGFTWTEVDIDVYAAYIHRFTVHSTSVSDFAVAVTSQPDGAGEEMLTAAGFPTNDMKLSWVWWLNNDDSPRAKKMYIGVRNTGAIPSTFSITDMRGYALEV